jgi:predicted membrane channel-forming protein YqfA (hemolysin III family)
MMGVVGAIKLKAVVDSTDYINLCTVAVSGGVLLIGAVHLAGNIPKKCSALFVKLQSRSASDYLSVESIRQRKYLRKKTRSIQVFGVKCHPIRVLQHNTIFHYFNGAIDFIVTFLVAYPLLGIKE